MGKGGGRPGGGPPGREGAMQSTQAQQGAQPAGQRSYGVWILETGKPKRVAIAVGISDGSFTEVVSGDLKEGQEVIVESIAAKKNNVSQQQQAPRFIR